jgi:hypothetical protein
LVIDGPFAETKEQLLGFYIVDCASLEEVVDGPFAETKEQLLGFYVVDCESLEEALDFAKELGKANPGGAYEVRPLAVFRPGSLAQ